MASITSPPSSPVPQPITITAQQLGSPARFALAVKLLQTKPSSLSISEYFTLLRANTVSGGRALNNTSERRHIEACEFWRKRSEAEAAKVVELQARISELTGVFNALTETNTTNHQLPKNTKVVVGQAPSEGPVKKKAKTKKGDTGKDENRTTNVVGKQKKSQQQAQVAVAEIESVFDEVFSVFLGSSISDLVSSLRVLHFAREPHLISKTITQSSQALQKVIEDFMYGRLSTPIHTAHFTRGATTAQMKEAKEIASFSQTVERSSNRILSALSVLVNSLQELGREDSKAASKQFIIGGTCAVVKNLVEIISSLHKNSIVLLSTTLSPQLSMGNHLIKDIRLELTMVIIRQLKSLKLELDYQRNILEGIFYHILEIIGGILQRAFVSTSVEGDEAGVLVKLAVDESSWYLLRILEAALPIVNCSLGAGNGKLEDKSRERLKGILIKGLFGSKTKEEDTMANGKRGGGNQEAGIWGYLEGSRFCDDDSAIESPFSRVLWDLLGLDVFSSDDRTE